MAGWKTRKKLQMEICLNPAAPVSGERGFGEGLSFLHRSLPELSLDEIRTDSLFLGHSLKIPFYISAMTGGHRRGNRLNSLLAEAAGELGIPLVSGSVRSLLEHRSGMDDFNWKGVTGMSPYFLNIGGQELRSRDRRDRLIDICGELRADGLIIHLNPGQELLQSAGERDFRGIGEAVLEFSASAPFPVGVKETGCGLHPREVQLLSDGGIAWIDVAGAGGTNWILVEGLREKDTGALPFRNWGHPTVMVLSVLKDRGINLTASGGLEDGQDAAVALAMGAQLAGFARPVLLASRKGLKGILHWFQEQTLLLKRTMLLTGCGSLKELAEAPLWKSPSWTEELRSYREAVE